MFMYKDFKKYMKIQCIYILYMINMQVENKNFYYHNYYKQMKNLLQKHYINYY